MDCIERLDYIRDRVNEIVDETGREWKESPQSSMRGIELRGRYYQALEIEKLLNELLV